MILKIASDLDGVIFLWEKAHESYFNCKLKDLSDNEITKQVNSLRYNAKFWSNLELLERPDFTPVCYCTKRVNSNFYTIANLNKYKLPIAPIIRQVHQSDNKALVLKGVADVLIDDSWNNVKQCLRSGFPALLITRPSNSNIKTKYRVNSLKYNEIKETYDKLFRRL